ncbi:MAG: leucine-rich repeat protein [Clostridia bacterium]|nr:leucine-rich repeat protein [Clostridia bacterium]
MKRIEKFVCIILSVTILTLSYLMIDVSAAVTGNLGVNETNITWSFDESTCILTVTGSGKMKSLNSSNGFSGRAKSVKQIIITGDIENIGSYCFGMCTSLVSISIPESITEIGNNSFLYCENLQTVYYAGTKAQWEAIEISQEGNEYLSKANINYQEEAHTCSFGSWSVISEPTCVSAGTKIRFCSCGKDEKEEIPVTGEHTFVWKTETSPTCTTDGIETQFCAVCNTTGESKTINKTGHKKGEWEDINTPTCTESGMKAVKCIECGEILDQQTILPTGHSFGAWKITVKETEEHDGEEQRTCKSCKLVETRVVDNIESKNDGLFGDVNNDGNVKASDARLVLQVVAGLKNTNEINFENADVNDDDKITSVDARMILQIVAGIK